MIEARGRRARPPTTLGGHLPVPSDDGREVRLLDLSGDDAQGAPVSLTRSLNRC